MRGLRRAAGLLTLATTWALLAAGPALAAPVLSVSTVVQPGGSVSVAGSGYGASEAVDIWLDEAKVATAVTNASGAFPGRSVPVAASTQPGTHVMTGVGRRTGTAAERVFLVRSSWYTERGGPARRGWSVTENTISPQNVDRLSRSWAAGSGPVYGEPAIRNGVMTFMQASSPTRLVAVNADTGAPRFSAAIPYVGHGGPAMGSSLIYAVAGQQLRVYSYAGALLWTAALGVEASTGPTYDGTTVYVGDAEGRIQAFPATCASTRCARLWRSAEGPHNRAEHSIAVYGGRVFGLHTGDPANADNDIFGYPTACATSCANTWRSYSEYSTDWRGIAGSNGLLWAWSGTGRLAAHSLSCGASPCGSAPIADINASSAEYTVGLGSPAIGHGRVALTGAESLLVYSEGCRSTSCEPLWRTSNPSQFTSSPTIANRLVYVADNSGNTRAYPLDCQNECRPAWIAYSRPTFVSPVVVNGRVYQATEFGVQTYALDAEGPERAATPLPR